MFPLSTLNVLLLSVFHYDLARIYTYPQFEYMYVYTVFSLTLARSPMASRSYRRASDFLNYLPRLASDSLVERKSGKFFFTRFFKNCFPRQPLYFSLPKANLIKTMPS